MKAPERLPAERQDVPPDSFVLFPADFAAKRRTLNTIPGGMAALDRAYKLQAGGITVPKEHTVMARVLQSEGPKQHNTAKGPPVARRRTAQSYKVVTAAWRELSPAQRELLAERSREVVYVTGGTENYLGRLGTKAVPYDAPAVPAPPSSKEVETALHRTGVALNIAPGTVKPFLWDPDHEGPERVRFNHKASNGLPVGGTWETAGAPERVLRIARSLASELATTQETKIMSWYQKKMETNPELVAVEGKCKSDYYPLRKVYSMGLRHYCCFPRQLAFIMQSVTQPFEELARNIFHDSEFHTGIGISLHSAGADLLVTRLDEQLARDGVAYCHVGDDTFLAARLDTAQGPLIILLALDCTAFDMTINNSVLRPIVDAFYAQLRNVEAKAAALWRATMYERLEVVHRTIVGRSRHGNPSGNMLVSKVNSAVMDVLVQRVLRKPARLRDEVQANSYVAEVAASLGFTARVEQYELVKARTVRQALQSRHFLFIGYNFWSDQDRAVHVYVDWVRAFAQARFPRYAHVRDDKELLVREALRFGNLTLNLGTPPPELVKAFAAYTVAATELLRSAYDVVGDKDVTNLRWVVDSGALGPEPIASIRGVLSAIVRKDDLWEAKVARPGVRDIPKQVMVQKVVPKTWADLAEDDSDDEVVGVGLPTKVVEVPLASPHVLEHKLTPRLPRTRGVRRPKPSAKTVGRMPPTKPYTAKERLRQKQAQWDEELRIRRAAAVRAARDREQDVKGAAGDDDGYDGDWEQGGKDSRRSARGRRTKRHFK